MDLIVLIILYRRVKAKALRKGVVPRPYLVRLVLLWIGLEMLGMLIGLRMSHNILLAGLLGFGLAMGSFMLTKYQLDKLPDQHDNWMDRIGKDK